jgi:serine/threonine protein kinase
VNLSPGDRIYKYVLQDRIDNGQGAFGQVWTALDQTVDSIVALKVLGEQFGPAIRNLREARIGNALDHPNLTKVLYADIVQHKSDRLTRPWSSFRPPSGERFAGHDA